MTLEGITIAVNDMEAMRHFYQEVFKLDFNPFELAGNTLYTSHWDGIIFTLCPAEMAKIEAKQNKHQFDVLVNDLEESVVVVLKSGGSIMGDKMGNSTQKEIGIRDPDGNSLVLKEYTF